MGKQNKIISMNKVINVVLICDNYDLAINIQNILLDKKMIAGCQMMEINSKYFWNKELFNKTEYRIDMKTVDSLYKSIYDEVRKVHNYEVFELSYYEISANKEFIIWVNEEVRQVTSI